MFLKVSVYIDNHIAILASPFASVIAWQLPTQIRPCTPPLPLTYRRMTIWQESPLLTHLTV